MLRTSNSKYLSQTSLFVQTPQGCSLPPFSTSLPIPERRNPRGCGRHIWVVKQAAVLTSFFVTCRLFMLTCTAYAVLNSKLQWPWCPVCCDELPNFHLAAFRKIYYICTFVHLHRVTERLRINLYRNSTVKLIITCYTQVSTFNLTNRFKPQLYIANLVSPYLQ